MPPINPPTHPPIGGGVSTDVKSLNKIEISPFILDLLHVYFSITHMHACMWGHVRGTPDTPTPTLTLEPDRSCLD